MHDVFEDNIVNKLNAKTDGSNQVANAFNQYFKSNEESKNENK